MATELSKTYDPKTAQTTCLNLWESRGFFRCQPGSDKPKYCIVIPPPNVTGALHLGHAVNNTLQDVLIRWRRMQGYDALWVPGTDHAGIATQSVVERRIQAEEKKTRHDLGREEMIKRIWSWKDQYESRILNQLKQLGASCDWHQTRFTLDEICTKAVRETFFNMFRDGYIYQGKRLVNWDTQLQTSVADDETYTEDTKGGFWTFEYPIVGDNTTRIRFSTTRPETMLGDTAVCVHPDDQRYKHLVGKKARIPLNGREIPVIADGGLADPKLGTGCVKVTPAHDPNDYECWRRNPEIGMINILNPDGTINAEGGEFAGLDRYKAREAVIAKMEEMGYYIGKEDRVVPLKYSDRSKTPIEPLLSDQWFVGMQDRNDGKPGLAQLAMDAVSSGKIRFTPERYAKSYLDWLGEKRDWCISRQLWWGHRISVWTMRADNESQYQKLKNNPILADIDKNIVTVSWHDDKHTCHVCLKHDDPSWIAKLCDIGFEQTDDVLDTWFSSALWPHSTLGWPDQTELFQKYYPTSVLCTSRDIITLWVARMVLAGLYNCQKIPFHHVYIHPKVMDGFGEGMSKTKGNGVDPLDIIDIYGCDAMRYGVVALATETQDSRMPVTNICPHCNATIPVKQEHMYMRTKKLVCPSCIKSFRPGGPWPTDDPELPTAKQGSDRFEIGRNFANKIWNAARFIMMNHDGSKPTVRNLSELPVEDRWMLSRLATSSTQLTTALGEFRFADTTKILYELIWSDFCDWYIEIAKERLRDPLARPLALQVLTAILDGILRLTHPVMPFIAETVWQSLNELTPTRGITELTTAAESVAIAQWPEYPKKWVDSQCEADFANMQELVRSLREVRNRYQLEPSYKMSVSIQSEGSTLQGFNSLKPFIASLAGVGDMTLAESVVKPNLASSLVRNDYTAYVALSDFIDIPAELTRTEKQLLAIDKQLLGIEAKLSNEKYVNNAPAEVVAESKAKLAELKEQLQSLSNYIKELSAAGQ